MAFEELECQVERGKRPSTSWTKHAARRKLFPVRQSFVDLFVRHVFSLIRARMCCHQQHGISARRSSMHSIKLLLAACLVIPLGACAGSQGGAQPPAAPPVVKRELLIGAWGALDSFQLLQKIEFKEDGSVKVNFKEMPEAVPGKFSWIDDRSGVLEYQASDAAKKAFQPVIKKVRAQVKQGVAKRYGDKRGEEAASVYPLELPAKETLRIGLAQNQLVLETERGLKLSFDRK
jgi:hypothetical protein